MNSYTFFFNERTFERNRLLGKGGVDVPIDYVGMANKKPFNTFQAGDELFIVGVSDGKVHLAGRMVVATPPVTREMASKSTGRSDFLPGVDLICLGELGQLDHFRPELTVPSEIARSLELYTSEGKETDVSSLRNDKPAPNLFRACPRLSEESAERLRRLLGLSNSRDAEYQASISQDETAGIDDEEYQIRAIKTRRGQPVFRKNLLSAYRSRCAITNCHIEGLLEAARITAHAELTDYRVSNGLLLRADIHTLFDLSLIAVDEFYRVVVSPTIRNTEYWSYNGRTLSHLPGKTQDQPNRDALRGRASSLKFN